LTALVASAQARPSRVPDAAARPEGITLTPRLFVPLPLVRDGVVTLPAPAARHVQVLRLQPGDAIRLFNGSDGADWPGEIVRIGRRDVEVRLGAPLPVDRELSFDVTIALGVPANDRMDALVEKAGELGAAAIQPLVCERSVVRLAGERAEARRAHWQAVAAAASEQCGRARVAAVHPVVSLTSWLEAPAAAPPSRRVVLSLSTSALDPERALGGERGRTGSARESIVVLSGPEGGLAPAEEAAAVALGFVAVGLGSRVLRADTAPLALLAWLGLRASGESEAKR
jgi:16S rRNA (uracil1498-N3)-methyltransferase